MPAGFLNQEPSQRVHNVHLKPDVQSPAVPTVHVSLSRAGTCELWGPAAHSASRPGCRLWNVTFKVTPQTSWLLADHHYEAPLLQNGYF